ncbi:outer membrane protein assembly factor BamB [Streptomyces sp. SAI-170]|uniref:outer membrane protein assembly factor BamB family protein n=1 Tax=Streptomyces sp. SAI-170 TaxID=3377729 RepID=UPI003C7D6C36
MTTQPPHLGGAPQEPPGFGPPAPPAATAGPGFGPPTPMAPPGFGPPPRMPRRGLRALVVVAAVAVTALLAGLGVRYGTGSDPDPRAAPSPTRSAAARPAEKAPADPTADFTTVIEAPRFPAGKLWSFRGSWLTDTTFAKVTGHRVQAWKAGTDDSTWTLPLSGLSCGGSTEVGPGQVAVVVHEDGRRGSGDEHRPCTQVTAFDLDTGDRLWTRTVTGTTGDLPIAFERPVISGDTVAVAGIYGGAAFDLRTGALTWRPDASRCVDENYAGGPRLVAVVACSGTDDEVTYQVQQIDPGTGAVRWRYRLPRGTQRPRVLSTQPVVLAVVSGDIVSSTGQDIFSLDAQGRLRTRFRLEDDVHTLDCSDDSGCTGAAVGNDRLYVGTEHDSADQVIAYSLATGRTTGQRVDAEGAALNLLRMDGPNVLAFQIGLHGPRVVSLDGRTLRPTTLLQASDAEGMPGDRGEVRYAHGRLYISAVLLYGPSGTAGDQSLTWGCATDG